MKKLMINSMLMILYALTACQRSVTVRGDLDVFVTVKTEDGQPVPLAPIYIAEAVGTSEPTLTEKVGADIHGSVHIKGSYCFPVEIVTNGGGIAINIENIKNNNVIYISNTGKPTVKDVYGKIPADIDYIRTAEWFRECRLPMP